MLSYRALVWKNGMGYVKKFSMELNMEWKIFSVERNGRLFGCMEYGKIIFHSIPWHALRPSTHKRK